MAFLQKKSEAQANQDAGLKSVQCDNLALKNKLNENGAVRGCHGQKEESQNMFY